MSKLKFILPLGGLRACSPCCSPSASRTRSNNGVLASVLIGKPAPDFTLPSLTDPGTNVSPKEFKGKPYLLNVWGTWCAACRVEHPVLHADPAAGGGADPRPQLERRRRRHARLARAARQPVLARSRWTRGARASSTGACMARPKPSSSTRGHRRLQARRADEPGNLANATSCRDSSRNRQDPRDARTAAVACVDAARAARARHRHHRDPGPGAAGALFEAHARAAVHAVPERIHRGFAVGRGGGPAREVRELVVAGKSDDEIRDFMVARYGEFILFRPRFSREEPVAVARARRAADRRRVHCRAHRAPALASLVAQDDQPLEEEAGR